MISLARSHRETRPAPTESCDVSSTKPEYSPRRSDPWEAGAPDRRWTECTCQCSRGMNSPQTGKERTNPLQVPQARPQSELSVVPSHATPSGPSISTLQELSFSNNIDISNSHDLHFFDITSLLPGDDDGEWRHRIRRPPHPPLRLRPRLPRNPGLHKHATPASAARFVATVRHNASNVNISTSSVYIPQSNAADQEKMPRQEELSSKSTGEVPAPKHCTMACPHLQLLQARLRTRMVSTTFLCHHSRALFPVWYKEQELCQKSSRDSVARSV